MRKSSSRGGLKTISMTEQSLAGMARVPDLHISQKAIITLKRFKNDL